MNNTLCGICLNPTFDQPAGCLTRVVLCSNGTNECPHTLCWECVFRIVQDDGRFKCPYCRKMCELNRGCLPDTGVMNIGLCKVCKKFTDEFGPRMQHGQWMCMRCSSAHTTHETFVEAYEQTAYPPILKIYGTKEQYKACGAGDAGSCEMGTRFDENKYKCGIWRNDELHGQGVQVWANGERYEGSWKGGRRHDQGVYMWPNGDRYEGRWEENKRQGQGVQVWADGSRYEGSWENDKKHGQGVQVWADGNRYEGSFQDDKKHGQGVQVWADGSRYEGSYKNDKSHGQGVYVWTDGYRYEGSF